MNPYEDDGNSQEMVSPPALAVRPPGPPPSRPPGPPPPRPTGPPSRPAGPPPIAVELPPPSIPTSPPAAYPSEQMDNIDLADEHEQSSSPLRFQHTKSSPVEHNTNRDISPHSTEDDYAFGGSKHHSVEIGPTDNPLNASVPTFRTPPPPASSQSPKQPVQTKQPPSPSDHPSSVAPVAISKRSPHATSAVGIDEEARQSRREFTVQSLRTSAVKSKENLPNLGGLNSVLKSHVEVPADMLQHILFKDELAVAHFDVLYPDSPEYPEWVNNCRPRSLTRLIICTFGLFQLYLWAHMCCHFLQRWLCGHWEGCQEKIRFTRGKLVLTSFGRIIHWTQRVQQTTQLLDQRFYHYAEQQTQVLHVNDLAQINLHYSDHYLGGCDESGGLGWLLSCCRCCRDFETGVDLLFYGYGHVAGTDHSAFVRPTSHAQFVQKLNAACVGDPATCRRGYLDAMWTWLQEIVFGSSIEDASVRSPLWSRLSQNSFAYQALNAFSAPPSQHVQNVGGLTPLRIRIVSDPRDHVCNGEYGQEPLEDLSQLHARLVQALSNTRGQRYRSLHKTRLSDTRNNNEQPEHFSPAFVASSNTSNSSNALDEEADEHQSNPLNANTSWKQQPSLNNNRGGVNYSVEHATGDKHHCIPGVRDVCEELHSFTLVDDELQVTVPTRWLPLAADERILSGAGQFYRPSALDVAFSWLSLGVYYLAVVKPKLQQRVALFITTHRVVEISLRNRKHRVPPELGALDISIRSFLPQHIAAGYLASHPDAKLTPDSYTIASSILTSFGALTVFVRGTQLSFAQQLQLTTSRLDAVPLSGPTHLETQFFPDSMPPVSSSAGGVVHTYPDADLESGESSHCDDGGANPNHHADDGGLPLLKGKHDDRNLSLQETHLIPFVPGETLLHRYQAGLLYQPHSAGCVCLRLPCSFAQDMFPPSHHGQTLCCATGLCMRGLQSDTRHNSTLVHNTRNDLLGGCLCRPALCLRLLSCLHRPLLTSSTAVLSDHTFVYVATVHSLRKLTQQALSSAISGPPTAATNNGNNGSSSGSNCNSNSNTTYGNNNNVMEDGVLGEIEVDWLRCLSGAQGPKTRLKLSPFLVAWVPTRQLNGQSLSTVHSGAKPYALHPLCVCCSRSSSYLARYLLSIRTDAGVVFPLAEEQPFHNWVKDGALARFAEAVAAMQLFSTVEQLHNA